MDNDDDVQCLLYAEADRLYLKVSMPLRMKKTVLLEKYKIDVDNPPEAFAIRPLLGAPAKKPEEKEEGFEKSKRGAIVLRDVRSDSAVQCLVGDCILFFYRSKVPSGPDSHKLLLRWHVEHDIIPMLVAIQNLSPRGEWPDDGLPWLQKRITTSLRMFYSCPGFGDADIGLPPISFVEGADAFCGHCDWDIADGWSCACGTPGLFYCHRACQRAHFATHRYTCSRAPPPPYAD